MAIQDEMYKLIEQEINLEVKKKDELLLNINKTKEVAKMLTELSVANVDADNLVNQYMAGIRNICES